MAVIFHGDIVSVVLYVTDVSDQKIMAVVAQRDERIKTRLFLRLIIH